MYFRKYALLTALSLSTLLAYAQDAESLLKPCVECHGINGLATKPSTPHLDGQEEIYLYDSIRAFNSGSRKTAVAQHKGVSKDAAKAMANHYNSQKAKREKSAVDPALLARGHELYQSRCAECHPDNGREADKDAPLMAAQNVDYLTAQVIAFRKGERRFATMMDDGFKGLSEADLTAIAHFFASQDQIAPKTTESKRKRR